MSFVVPHHSDSISSLNVRITGLFQSAEKPLPTLDAYKCKRRSAGGLYAVTLSVAPDECHGAVRPADSPLSVISPLIVEVEDPYHCARLLEIECRDLLPAYVALYRLHGVSSKRLAGAVDAYHRLIKKLKIV